MLLKDSKYINNNWSLIITCGDNFICIKLKKLQRLLIKQSYILLSTNNVSLLLHSSKQDDYLPYHNDE